MRRKIPTNSALMAFEAAARHGSFSRAAEELAVSEGAISRQIARLETFLGVTLFARIGNRVRLLPNALNYAEQVRDILNRLEQDSNYIMGQPAEGESESITIATLPTFAARWLIPRLKRFNQKHPNITINLAEKMEPFIFAGSGFDAALHFEHRAWAGERTYRLFKETLIPVCHPSLIGDNGSKALLDDLPRLHRRQNPEAWQDYARETDITLTNPAIGARYDLHTMLIEAAISGLGVALVPRIYVKKELELGNLIAPWPESAIVSKTFCLVLPESIMLNELPVQKFAEWITKEAKEP